MNLNELTVFVKIVEIGSFTGAADILEMPKSTVSARLSSLEGRIGVTLIRRTTRRLFVTDEGKAYYQKCMQALMQISAAEEQIAQSQSEPKGILKITAPVELGVTLLPKILGDFQVQYPSVSLEVILSDKTMDLVSEGIDIALRAGSLKDSTLIAKKLGAVYFAAFASPQYLKKYGTPKKPQDLKDHTCLHFSPLSPKEWQLNGPGGSQRVEINKKIIINDMNLIKSMALDGYGIALLPTFYCFNESSKNSLVRVLDAWKSNQRSVQFVYPMQEFVPKKLSAFLNYSSDKLKQTLLEYNS